MRGPFLEVTYRHGRPLAAPSKLSLAALDRVLRELGFSPVTRKDVAPLLAA
jgi:hypothetical protein